MGVPGRNSEVMQGDSIWIARTQVNWITADIQRGEEERRSGRAEGRKNRIRSRERKMKA